MKRNIAVIGAGASGLAAAIAASKNAFVTVYERRDVPARKILATGNGHCNLINADQSAAHFHTSAPEMAGRILSEIKYDDILRFFRETGFLTFSKNGCVYPMSNQAQTVHRLLIRTARERGVRILCSSRVTGIKATEENVFIKTEKEKSMKYDYAILASGSGAGIRGYDHGTENLLDMLGESVIPFTPALCALQIKSASCAYWKGVRTIADISLFVNDAKTAAQSGELMLTDYGISGIPAFQISGQAAKALGERKKVSVCVDWVPLLSEDDLMSFLDEASSRFEGGNVSQLIEGILPQKLGETLCFELVKGSKEFPGVKAHDLRWKLLDGKQKKLVVYFMKNSRFNVTGVNGFENCQVCAGGVSLLDIDEHCCSVKNPRVYLTGELLDVNGDCGGYNLQWAFTTGLIAGKSAADRKD